MILFKIMIGLTLIFLLSGSTVPVGWAKCDGNNGTPNLINKFVFGAKVNAELKTTGGSDTHVHPEPNTGIGGAHALIRKIMLTEKRAKETRLDLREYAKGQNDGMRIFVLAAYKFTLDALTHLNRQPTHTTEKR